VSRGRKLIPRLVEFDRYAFPLGLIGALLKIGLMITELLDSAAALLMRMGVLRCGVRGLDGSVIFSGVLWFEWILQPAVLNSFSGPRVTLLFSWDFDS
jgi:hypothetical protein